MTDLNLYAMEVWEAHVAKSHVTTLASAMEWALIRHWSKTTPLRVVLQAIRDTAKAPRTLLYYEKPVEEAYVHWQRSLSL